MDYTELYEYLRKEKYGDQLQTLSKTFIADVSEFLRDRKAQLSSSPDMFSEELLRSKKQFENSYSIFRELLRIRKRKLLNLAFIASETGIMKRDFGMMLPFEQSLFERIVMAIDDGEKELQQTMTGTSKIVLDNKLVLVNQPISAFVDMSGSLVGPFDKGALVNLDSRVADILLADGKVSIVDDN